MWWGSSVATLCLCLSLSFFPTLLPSFAFYLLLVLVCLYIDIFISGLSAEPDNMASEPTEEAITSFVSFTSTTREQAIAFLKVGD